MKGIVLLVSLFSIIFLYCQQKNNHIIKTNAFPFFFGLYGLEYEKTFSNKNDLLFSANFLNNNDFNGGYVGYAFKNYLQKDKEYLKGLYFEPCIVLYSASRDKGKILVDGGAIGGLFGYQFIIGSTIALDIELLGQNGYLGTSISFLNSQANFINNPTS